MRKKNDLGYITKNKRKKSKLPYILSVILVISIAGVATLLYFQNHHRNDDDVSETIRQQTETKAVKEQSVSTTGQSEFQPEDDYSGQAQWQDGKEKKFQVSADQEEDIHQEMLQVQQVYRDLFLSNSTDPNAYNVHFENDMLHQMADAISKEGISVYCAKHDYNLTNADEIISALQNAKAGNSAHFVIYILNEAGGLQRDEFQFTNGSLYVTTSVLGVNGSMEQNEFYTNCYLVYQWEYTEKGWLIYETAPSLNYEMDLHCFIRIEPLDDLCREICSSYITPIGYNVNLFTTDWTQDNCDEIDFNDLYEYLYRMQNNSYMEVFSYNDGIEESDFETTIRHYFKVSSAYLKAHCGFDASTGHYTWTAGYVGTIIPQLSPIAEVVDCTDDGSGIVTCTVDGILTECGLDCAYRNIVTLERQADGTYKYIGNQVQRDYQQWTPDSTPRENLK